MKYLLAILVAGWLCLSTAWAEKNILNLYTWSEEIPNEIIAQFEKETGIKVNYATYDSNEVMYAKLRTNQNVGYDIAEPSSFLIERMQRQGMLEKLDKSKLPNFKHLDPFFTHQAYDPQSTYSIPFIWGITGIFVNKNYFSERDITRWEDLFSKKYFHQLMLLDEAREVFSMALLMLGYSINDNNPQHIKEAYLKIKALMANVKLFNSDAVNSLLIDEDATVGIAWNGDVFGAALENPQLQFIFPTDGFEIWVDNFVILKNAPHKENAYIFLNFLMRPDIAKAASLSINYSTANLSAQKSMPAEIRNNPTLYPSHAVLQKAQFEVEIGDEASALFEKYWELLKMGG